MANNIAHPLVRDGKSQVERLNLSALAPESVMLDDRSERQLLVYLNEFAKSVAFYDTDNTNDHKIQQSNWQSFFRSGSSVQVSVIEAFDIVGFENRFDQTQQNFIVGLERAEYAPILDFLFETALTINQWHDALSSDVVLLDNKVFLNETELRRNLRDLISSNLRSNLEQLIAVANLFVETESSKGYQFPDLTPITKNADIWHLSLSVRAARDGVLAPLSKNTIEFKQLLKERFDDIFRTFAKVIRKIVDAAAQQDILQATGTHEPHLALLYTFLRLFKHVVTDLNQLPQKHLDFYYREVLGLKLKSLTPDAAHIVFELPKNTPQYFLDKNTLLQDGKDAKGADVNFALDNEIVVTNTQIAELRTLFLEKTEENNNESSIKKSYLLARPKANSADGMGKDFKDPLQNQWATLGTDDNADNTKLDVGLAIASPILILESGIRKVNLTLNCTTLSEDLKAILTNKEVCFSIRLSGKKKWIPYSLKPADINFVGSSISIAFTLSIADEAVVAANPSVLGVDYGVKDAAVLQLILDQSKGHYDIFKAANITSVVLNVNVSQLQNVQIRTDEGDQDPTKPFMPFGAIPSVDSTFCIGSPEIFSKELKRLTVDYEWDKKPTDFKEHYKNYWINGNQTALPKQDSDFQRELFFFSNGAFVNKTGSSVFDVISITDFSNNTTSLPSVSAAKDAAWQAGFVAVRLKNDFLHTYYAESLSRLALFLADPTKFDKMYVKPTDIDLVKTNILGLTFTNPDFANEANSISDEIKTKSKDQVNALNNIVNTHTVPVSNADVEAVKNNISNLTFTNPDFLTKVNNIINDIKNEANTKVETLKSKLDIDKATVNPPYTPMIKNLTIGYEAETTEALLFNILPFDNGANFKQLNLGNTDNPLIFNFNDTGALLIGLSNAIEESLLPILFQMLESSANTNVTQADIHWQYLDGNQWTDLEMGKHILNDATEGLIKTGIIDIILPERKWGSYTTVLPPQYYWLKASSTGDLASICQTIGIHTQAVRATFSPSESSDSARLAQPLAAGSLAKLVVSDQNIKTVSQQYDSFGGLPNEDNTHYYRRVSDRLRHKGRAVTLFDYEQLVLEAFPEVFKVKCIPHTYSHIQSTEKALIQDIHNAPNHVTVVIVPNVQQTRQLDPLRPTASRALLLNIEKFLKQSISPFIRLQVLNPIYESINTSGTVKFKEGRSPQYYAEVLKKDMEHFLAPWAFDPTAQITFGGVVYLSSIIGFAEGRDYVDFVKNMEIYKLIINPEEKPNTNEITASAARSIMSSGTHTIDIFTGYDKINPAPVEQKRGIGIDWRIAKNG